MNWWQIAALVAVSCVASFALGFDLASELGRAVYNRKMDELRRALEDARAVVRQLRESKAGHAA